MNTLILRSLGTLIVTLSLISTVTHGGSFNNQQKLDIMNLITSLHKELEKASLYLKFGHKPNYSKTKKSEKDAEVVKLEKFLRDGIISITNTNNVHIFEKYLTEKFSPNDYYDAIIEERISRKWINLTLKNINKERKVIYDKLQSMTKEKIEYLLHEVLEKRIRKEASDALYASDKKLKVADVMKVYSEVKKLSIKDIRECINNVRSKDFRDVFHFNLLNNYYYSDEKQPST